MGNLLKPFFREVDDYNHKIQICNEDGSYEKYASKYYKVQIKITGVTNACCVDDNITYSDSNEFLKCAKCNNRFSWENIRTYINKKDFNRGIRNI